jgi:hypothetical protein
MLGELRIEQADGGDVETIEPDHRLVGGVAMVMPLAARRQHQIVLAHDRLLAIERGEGPVALHHEAQRALAVAVAGGDLARQDQLQPA